jgi:ElaB/YqjD/DUF883 family membrane-anchored ribosome-binding protein
MGQSTEELTSRIEDTRGRMAQDLDTLQDRVSPSAIVERRKKAARHRLSSMKDKVMGSGQSAGSAASSAASAVSDTASDVADQAEQRFEGAPLAAGLVAFGAGVVMGSLLPASRAEAEAAHRVVETAKEHGQPMLDEVRAAGQDVADNLKESAAEAAQQVKDSAQESTQKVKDEGASSAQSVRQGGTY